MNIYAALILIAVLWFADRVVAGLAVIGFQVP